VTPLHALLLERIRSHGPITVAEYMAAALYHPLHGYYAAGGARSGWRGDYVTSAELHPVFAEMWTEFFGRVWNACGSPERYELVEIGPGEGAFARAVLDSARGSFGDALQVRLVERLPALRTRQQALLGSDGRVAWRTSLHEVAPVSCGCLFANEVLDNLPVHVVERRGGQLAEIWVDADGDELVTVRGALSGPELGAHLGRAAVEVPEGHVFEVSLDAIALVRRAAGALRRGALVLVDYGMEAPDLIRRPGGTLAAYSAAGADGLILDRPGCKDITAHVDWTSVRGALLDEGCETTGPSGQAEVLRRLGLVSLDRAGRADASAALQEGDGAAALRLLSRRSALAALSDPGGLGSLSVMVATRGVAGDELLRRDEDRREAGPRVGSKDP
jgi:SAM-dependent MidA family methyltransferase